MDVQVINYSHSATIIPVYSDEPITSCSATNAVTLFIPTL